MPRKTYRNKITSEELTSQINPENISLMKRFLKDKQIRTSAKTITVYESNLIMFFTWNLLNNNNKKFTDIKKLEFSEFFSFASDELKLGSARLNNIRSTLSSLSNFIMKFYDEEYPNFRNVILNVIESSPKEMRREKTILTDEQIEDLLNYLEKKDKQQACWVALAITSGARFAELLCFETDLIDENRTAFGDLFLETTRQIKTKGRGKSGKLLYKYILREKFLPFYKEWIKERDKILKEKKLNHNFLFIKQDGNPATGATVRGWIDDFEKYLGVPFYAHALRHYLVTLFSKKNIPPFLIKELMGWSSLEMVQIYDDSSMKDREYDELKNLKL
jgi:site-specific recombinase XerD